MAEVCNQGIAGGTAHFARFICALFRWSHLGLPSQGDEVDQKDAGSAPPAITYNDEVEDMVVRAIVWPFSPICVAIDLIRHRLTYASRKSTAKTN